jgi:hypothetical protein
MYSEVPTWSTCAHGVHTAITYYATLYITVHHYTSLYIPIPTTPTQPHVCRLPMQIESSHQCSSIIIILNMATASCMPCLLLTTAPPRGANYWPPSRHSPLPIIDSCRPADLQTCRLADTYADKQTGPLSSVLYLQPATSHQPTNISISSTSYTNPGTNRAQRWHGGGLAWAVG